MLSAKWCPFYINLNVLTESRPASYFLPNEHQMAP